MPANDVLQSLYINILSNIATRLRFSLVFGYQYFEADVPNCIRAYAHVPSRTKVPMMDCSLKEREMLR